MIFSKNTAKILLYLSTAICLLCIVLFRQHKQQGEVSSSIPFTRIEGSVFHTLYHIQYADSVDYHPQIKQLFAQFDGSLSMFNDTSIISRMNQNDPEVIANCYVRTVFEKALEVSNRTNGAFDITVAPLVNLWGFGFKNSDNVNQQMIDSILPFVGYQGVCLDVEGHLHKNDPRTILDASSIAKGYMCDIVADFLQSKGVNDYMIEIGGELAIGGHNAQDKIWSVGINQPVNDSLQIGSNELRDIMHITDCGVATSGNYRNFYYKDGQRYAHTIDPKTGYPVQQDILSSTVIAPDCMTADAYATAFMVMGSERALRVLAADTTLMAYFIVTKPDSDETNVIYSPGLKKMLGQ